MDAAKRDARRALVIGAEGMLGREVMRSAPNADEDKDAIVVTGADIEEVDITDVQSVERLLDKTTPDVIINCAAYTDVDACETEHDTAFAVNGAGPGNLAKAATGRGARLIHVSTDFVFDGERDEPYGEENEPRPVNAYGESKLEGERRIREIGGDHAILRTAWLYGQHGKNFVDTIRRLAGERSELSVVTDQIGGPTWAADLAQTLWLAAFHPMQGVYHAVNGGSCSRFEWAREIVRLAGLHCIVQATTSESFPLPARRPACSILNTEKLCAATGSQMRSWRAALAEYLREG